MKEGLEAIADTVSVVQTDASPYMYDTFAVKWLPSTMMKLKSDMGVVL